MEHRQRRGLPASPAYRFARSRQCEGWRPSPACHDPVAMSIHDIIWPKIRERDEPVACPVVASDVYGVRRYSRTPRAAYCTSSGAPYSVLPAVPLHRRERKRPCSVVAGQRSAGLAWGPRKRASRALRAAAPVEPDRESRGQTAAEHGCPLDIGSPDGPTELPYGVRTQKAPLSSAPLFSPQRSRESHPAEMHDPVVASSSFRRALPTWVVTVIRVRSGHRHWPDAGTPWIFGALAWLAWLVNGCNACLRHSKKKTWKESCPPRCRSGPFLSGTNAC